METRRAAELNLQREPAVSPELADAIAAVRGGYNPEVEAAEEENRVALARQRIADGTKRIGDESRPPVIPKSVSGSRVDNFVANMSALQAGKAKQALLKNIQSGGNLTTLSALVESRVANGATVEREEEVDTAARNKLQAEYNRTKGTHPFGNQNHPETIRFNKVKAELQAGGPKVTVRRLVNADGETFLSEKSIGKTAMDYAEHLLAKPDSPTAPGQSGAPTELTPPAAQQTEVERKILSELGERPPLEGQPYEVESGKLKAESPEVAPPSTFNLQPSTRGEAAMETRRAAPLNLQREPAVSPELADAIAAVRGGYKPEVEAQFSPTPTPTLNPKPAPPIEESLSPAVMPVPLERQAEFAAAAARAPWATDLQRRPTGWKIIQFREGATLVSLDGKQMVRFEAADKSSGTEALRKKMEAQAWAMDNPLSLGDSGPAPQTPSPTPPDQSGGPTELTPPAKAAVDELSELRQQAKELDAKIQKSKSGTEANRKRLAEWMRLTAQIAKLETGQTAAATVKPAEVRPAEPGEQPQPPAQAAPAMQEGMDNLRFTSEPVAKAKSGAPDAKDAKAKLIAELEKAVAEAPALSKAQAEAVEEMRKAMDAPKLLRTGRMSVAEAQVGKSGLRKVTIEIPGDGTFTVWNTKENLTELLKRAKRLETSTKPPKGFTETGVAKEDREWVEQMQAAQGKPVLEWQVNVNTPSTKNVVKTVSARTAFEAEQEAALLPDVVAVQKGTARNSVLDQLHAALEAAKVKPGGPFALPDLGLTVTLWNGTLTAAQLALRAGRSLAQAVQAGVDWLRAQGQQFDEAKVRAALEQGILQAPGIREHVGKRLLQEDFSPAAKAALEPLLRYEVKPDAQLFAEAAAVVEAIGPMEAEANYWGNPWGLPADAHVVLGFAIGNGLSTLEAQARSSGDTALADRIGRQNAEFQSQFVLQSTETARTLRAYRYFDLVGNLSPFTADLFARKVIEQASQKQKQRLKPTLDAAKQQLDDLNRTGIEEAARTPEVQGTARTVINQAIEEEARQAGTPVQQAIAAEVVAQLQTAGRLNAVEAAIVREHFGQNPEPLALADKLERAGVKPAKARAAELEGKYKDGVEAFRAKLRQKLAEARKKDIDPATLGIVDKAIRQRLADLQVKLGALVRQHWTQQERVGQTLADSLVQEAGLPEAQATRLADAIQRRFKALVQARKEKALRNLAKTPGARELQKPSVAQRIIEATNLGALDSEGLWQAVAEKLGLPTYTADASAEVKRLAERAQQLPEGSVQRRKATADMMNYIARRKGVKRGDLAWAFWYGNVLSDPRTWAVNFGDTGLNAMASTAAVFTTEPGGVPQAIRQVPRAVGKGMAEAREVWRTGQDLRTHKEGDLSAPVLALYDRKAGFGPMMAWLYSNVGKVMTATDVFWQQATREMKAVQLARIMAKEEGLAGNSLRLRVEEILNNTTERRGQLEAQLQREATQMRAAGMEPDALWEQRRLYQLEEELRGPELEARANDFAARAAYNNEPYGVMGAVTNAIELGTRAMEAQAEKTGNERTAALASLARRFVIPFTRIPANAWNERLNYTPLGLARGTWAVLRARVMPDGQQRLYGREVQPGDVAEVLVKGAGGTLAMATLVLAGLKALDDDEGWQIHGAGPRNSDHRKTLRGTKWIPFSFQIGDKFVSFANTPFAAALAMVGNYVDRHRYKDADADGALDEARLAAMGAVQVFEQQTYIDAVARTLGLLDNVNDKTPVRIAEVLGRGGASFVPVAGANVLRAVDRADDPKVYQAKTVSDALLFGFPFVRRIGQPALNEFGEPVTLDPMARFYTTRKEDVLVDLVRRGIYPTKPNKAVNRSGREMTEDEFYRYVQESGQAIKRRLEQLNIRALSQTELEKEKEDIVREERAKVRRRLGF